MQITHENISKPTKNMTAFATSAAALPRAFRHALGTNRRPLRAAARPRRQRATGCARNTAVSGTGTADALARFSSELHAAHVQLEASSELVLPAKGASALATAEGVDIPELSYAYGHILAREGRTLSDRLDADAAASALVSAASSIGALQVAPAPLHEFEVWLRAGSGSGAASVQMSEMYGFVLGRALSSSALELDATRVACGLRDACAITAPPFPMDESRYDAQFEILQTHAQTLSAEQWLRASDAFFKMLRANDGVLDMENDGFVLAIDGVSNMNSAVASAGDVVELVLHGRFLDGRSFVVPTYSDGLDCPPDTVRMQLDEVPGALRNGIVGMRIGECRALFLHTYAAVDVIDLFGARDKFPPNVALVFDIYLQGVHTA